MIHPSVFLRRAILADAIFSGASAVLLTFGAGMLAPLLSLPEALLRETGLFLIAYAALVGWLGTRQSMPRPWVVIVIAGNAAWTLASIALLFSRRGNAKPARRRLHRDAGDRRRRPRRIAICRPAPKRRHARGLTRTSHAQAIQNAYKDVWIAWLPGSSPRRERGAHARGRSDVGPGERHGRLCR